MRIGLLIAVVLFAACGSLNPKGSIDPKPESRALGFAAVPQQAAQVVDPTVAPSVDPLPTDVPAVTPTPIVTPAPSVVPDPTAGPTPAPTAVPTAAPTIGHVRYAGIVTDGAGAPIANVCVYAGYPAGCPQGAPRTDANGAWWVDLPSGIAFLWNFEAQGFQPTTLSPAGSVRMTAIAPTTAPASATPASSAPSAAAPAAPAAPVTAQPTVAPTPTPAPVPTTLTGTTAPGLVIACVYDENWRPMNGQSVTIQRISGDASLLVSVGVQTTGTGGTDKGCAVFAWRVQHPGADEFRLISGSLSALVTVSIQ